MRTKKLAFILLSAAYLMQR